MTESNQQVLGKVCGEAFPGCDSGKAGEPKPPGDMKFGVVYDSSNNHVSFLYLSQAIPEDRRFHLDLSVLKPNFEIEPALRSAGDGEDAWPDAILHGDNAPGLPHGLHKISIPTARLDFDSFGWTSFRLKWAMLFDYVFTWHLSYVRLFQEAGHPRVFALPHAVDARFFTGADFDSERFYDLGFVGRSGLNQYVARDRVNARLTKRFRTNDLDRSYTKEEMSEIYKRSKIVVNVSRCEFPQEANMRCYEAMAGGALLITGLPSELTEWGFREGEHFIGWRSEHEIPDLVDRFLRQTEQRLAIARAGQQRTLKDFTYQRCIESIADTIRRDEGQLFAPARQWPAEKVHLLYLSYYHRYFLSGAVMDEFQLLRRMGARAYWQGLPLFLRTYYRVLKSSLL
jgi:glycosyltransferase involved in cell wall biosynthesis